MPQLLINEDRYHLNIENIRTLKELIPKIKDEFVNKNEFLSEILLDGKSIRPGILLDLLDNSINEKSSIQFKINKQSIAQETLNKLPDFLEILISEIRLFNTSKQEVILLKIVEKIDTFIKLMTEIHKVMCIKSDQILDIGLTIKELEVHLLFIVRAINSAVKRADNIVLEDLLEHELIDNLTQWKIQALPQIKQLNSL